MSTVAVKERPILFSGPMVRAILDGRKTQTRRMLTYKHAKRLGLETCGEELVTSDGPYWDGSFEGGKVPWCPYGQPGEQLWVRETYALEQDADGCKPSDVSSCTWYSADGEDGVAHATGAYPVGRPRGKWRPSIHMPRWASRITLEITGVRVERLNEISEVDAQAEGVEPDMLDSGGVTPWGVGIDVPCYSEGFVDLWQSINGPDSWSLNPWVWVIEFEKVKP